MTNYYKIEPDLSDDLVAYIDDWEFTYWPNKPKGEIIRNPNGTFSVIMEKDFIPLVTQLQNLFEDGKSPESGTYLGEAVLTGKNEPLDCIYGNFINEKQGLVVSNKLLKLLENYKLPEHFVYELPLIKKRKTYDHYYFILFKNDNNGTDLDIRLIMDDYTSVVCVSDKIKEDICTSDIKGCKFTKINKVHNNN
ncbi:MAG: hypothetical protein RLZ33_191 [Bacteroidota bacterium]|jgi:hypothetical protein